MSQKQDILFGNASELANHNLLQLFLDTKLERKGGYAVFDYENPTRTIFVELKSRRIKHDTYTTAIIGLNKIAFADHIPDAEFWLAFCYSDGLYVIKYDKEYFDTLEVCHNYVRGPRNDTHNRPQSVVFIPTDRLTKVEEESLVEKAEVRGVKDDEKEEPKGLNGTFVGVPPVVGSE